MLHRPFAMARQQKRVLGAAGARIAYLDRPGFGVQTRCFEIKKYDRGRHPRSLAAARANAQVGARQKRPGGQSEGEAGGRRLGANYSIVREGEGGGLAWGCAWPVTSRPPSVFSFTDDGDYRTIVTTFARSRRRRRISLKSGDLHRGPSAMTGLEQRRPFVTLARGGGSWPEAAVRALFSARTTLPEPPHDGDVTSKIAKLDVC